jgi:hypothetical protein
MSLVLGKNASNELKEINLTNSGLLKIDLAGSSGGAIAANVDVTGNTIGLATESTVATLATESTLASVQTAGAATSALQTTVNTSLAGIETDTGSIDTATTAMNGKMSQGYDAQIASGGSGAQQVLAYGRDGSGNLDALKTDASGHLEITVDDFVKGQATSANSFPVVIASDQSPISVSTAGANTTNVNESLAGTASGTANSTAVDMDGSTNLTIFGTSTNTSDPIIVQVSHNGTNWQEHTEYFVNFSASGGAYAVRISAEGARYWRVSQTDTLASAFTLVVNSSKK